MLFLRCCASTLLLVGSALSAQPVKMSPRSVVQIVEASLDGVLTPSFTRTTDIEERSLVFDRQRTMAEFGAVDDTTALSALGFRRVIATGTRDLLEGCSQAGVGECSKLGSSTYVLLAPVSMTDTTAVVWLYFYWATKVKGRTFLSGISTQVHLSRTGTGPWRFVRTGLSGMS